MAYNRIFKPLKKIINIPNNNIYGFDIETKNKNKNFLMGSLVNDKETHFFDDKIEMQNFINNIPKNKYGKTLICATNLKFDIGALYGQSYDKKENSYLDISPMIPFFRNSSMILCKNRLNKNITCIDTLNYAQMSVEKLGNFLKIPKFKSPDFEKIPKKDTPLWEYWKNYNIRDSLISFKFIEYMRESIFKEGGKLKYTIASTSLDLFRRNFLNEYIKRPLKEMIVLQRNAYFGGRCEAYKRGKIENCFMYDFKSMYPSVMLNSFPNPNYMLSYNKGYYQNIYDYEGISEVEIQCDYMYYPLLPLRINNKLIFPYGKFKGFYSHIELRKAEKIGYKILNVKTQIIFTRNHYPFKKFVEIIYNKRRKFQLEKNPMELTLKLVLNSLYGKFGTKIENVTEIMHIDDCLNKIKEGDIINFPYVTLKKEMEEKDIPSFIIPIYPIYITSLARIKLYNEIIKLIALYTDTDSLLIEKRINSGSELGDLELKETIESGIIVKPKHYKTNNEEKIKGLPKNKKGDFERILDNKEIKFLHIMGFKECLKSIDIDKYFNKPKIMTKKFDLEDNKRLWNKPFDFKNLNDSKPIKVYS